MNQTDTFQKQAVPITKDFDIATICSDKSYIIFGNFYYRSVTPEGCMINGGNQIPYKSGLSSNDFFEMVSDFSKQQNQRVVMAGGNDVVITGSEETLEAADIHCGERFSYTLVDAEGLKGYCDFQKNVLVEMKDKPWKDHYGINEALSSLRLDA